MTPGYLPTPNTHTKSQGTHTVACGVPNIGAVHEIFILMTSSACTDPEGVTGLLDPPGKITKL